MNSDDTTDTIFTLHPNLEQLPNSYVSQMQPLSESASVPSPMGETVVCVEVMQK